MLGIDIVETSRFLPLIHDQTFLDRVFTLAEQAYCFMSSNESMQAMRLASRFSAKEAVFKAVEAVKVLHFHEIEVMKTKEGAPYIVFHGETKKIVEESNIEVKLTLSHSKEYAVAAAMVIPKYSK